MTGTADLSEVLERPPSLRPPLRRITYDLGRMDLRPLVAAHVERVWPGTALPLETLHRRIPLEYQLPRDDGPNVLNTEIADLPECFGSTYRRLVKDLAARVLGFDVVFERSPPLRFHFPVALPDRYRSRAGHDLSHHSDTVFGDPFEQINCWLPLTNCAASSTLQVLDFEPSLALLRAFADHLGGDAQRFADSRQQLFEFLDAEPAWQRLVVEETRPVPARVGELLLFDTRTVHGTAHNVEDATRVSIDFRVVATRDYDALHRRLAELGRPVPLADGELTVRGELYDERTAAEVP